MDDRMQAEENEMRRVDADEAKEKLAELVSEINRSHHPLRLDCGEHSAVILSERTWRSIQETLFVHSVPEYADKLLSGLDENLEEMADACELEW